MSEEKKPVRIQRKREKGWKLPENSVCVDRSTRWGNPFKVWDLIDSLEGKTLDAKGAVFLFEQAIITASPVLGFRKEELWKLRGKNLACFCPTNSPCHADVLLELANKTEVAPCVKLP